MSDSIKDRLTTDLQKAKVESGTRLTRIGKAFQSAASQAMTEFKEGSSEIQEIAKGTISSISETVSKKTEESESRKTDSTSFRTLGTTVFNLLSAQLRIQMASVDAKLTERYSDRYLALKHRAKNFVAWYNDAKSTADSTGSSPLQQKQVELEHQVGEAGVSVARKEQQIRQQLKGFLQTAAAKL